MAGRLFHGPIVPPYYIEDCRILGQLQLKLFYGRVTYGPAGL